MHTEGCHVKMGGAQGDGSGSQRMPKIASKPPEVMFLLFKAHSSWFFVMAALADEYSVYILCNFTSTYWIRNCL